MSKILILGATSAIAQACARRWAERGAALHLLGRDRNRLDAIAADLRLRGACEVGTNIFDANDADHIDVMLETARIALGGIDIALIAHGTLPDAGRCERDINATLAALTDNGASTIAWMTGLAGLLESQGTGTLAVISSVAGDRGRASNAAYGAAKAAVSTYASALRQRLSRSGVRVTTIKPGLIDTPMTAHFDKGALWSTPERIAPAMVRGIEAGRAVVYLPWFWRPIMTVIRLLPDFVFSRLRF